MAAKSKKGGKSSKSGSSSKLENAGPSMLEVSLRVELEQLEKELDVVKREAADAKRKNEWLLAEMGRVDEETREYEAYMMKKTVQEQARIKNISEFNQQELDAIESEKNKRLAEYEKQKRGMLPTRTCFYACACACACVRACLCVCVFCVWVCLCV
jgi:hypothetical protein